MAKTKVHGEYLDPSVISGQTQVTAVGADSVLILDATDNALKKALLSDVIETVGSTPTFSQINATSDLTVDAGGEINIDSASGVIRLKDGGTQFGAFIESSNNFIVKSQVNDGDLVLMGVSGGSEVSALTLDMSNAGAATFNGDVTLTSASSTKPFLTIKNTNADDAAPQLRFSKDSASPADNDEVGRIYMFSDDDAGSPFEAVLVRGIATDVSNGSEDSTLEFFTYSGGSQTSTLSLVSGDVGVGLTNPDGVLHIKGSTNKTIKIDSTFSSGSHTALAFARNGTDKWRIFQQSDDSHLSFYNEQAGIFDLSLKSNGYIGVGDTNPQHKLKVHLTNGQIAMFGSNNMNSPGNYAGIGLGQVIANGTTHQKVSLVTEGRNSGNYIQDFHILVDTASDSGSAVLSDSKFKIDGGTGAITTPSQPVAQMRGSGGWVSAGTASQWNQHQGTVSAYYNVGSNFNNSTKRFTAPVAGYYLCHSSSYVRWNSSTQSYGGQYLHPAHFKNGSASWANGDHPYQIVGHTLDGSSAGYVDGLERFDIIYCAAGDYIDWRLYLYGSSWEVYKDYQHSSFYLLG